MTPSFCRLSYLVGGLRISVGQLSTTPGPRTHILGFTRALDAFSVKHVTIVASELPGLGRFARLPEGVAARSSRVKVLIGDLVRIAAALWCGINVLVREWPERRTTTIVYERMGVFQSLASFHPAKKRAVRVVESQSLLANETARDRQAIVLERLAAWLERRSFEKADLIVAVSPGVRDDILKFARVQREKVLVLPNATSQELARRPIPPLGKTTIGFVGAVVPWHRLDRLLEAVQACGDPGVDVEIVGDGPAVEPLRRLTEELGMTERVAFTGRLSHAEALERVASWSVGYAGHEKTWATSMYHSPLKLYEYAALGLQILCTRAPDALTLKRDGVSVHDFEASDTDSLGEALQRSIECARLDSDEARASRRRIVDARHTWEARVQEFLLAIDARTSLLDGDIETR
nr:glycosyltransferase [Microbacterium aquimaris]